MRNVHERIAVLRIRDHAYDFAIVLRRLDIELWMNDEYCNRYRIRKMSHARGASCGK